MSEENVELVRQVYAEWEKGNFEAAVESFDPEITFESFMPDASEDVILHGLNELRAFTRDWFTQWRDYRVTGEEFQAVGEDKVIASGRQIATGRHSGVEVESPAFTIWTIRQGKVLKLSAHYDRSKALEAAGLQG